MAKANPPIHDALRVILDEILLPYQRADVLSPDRFRWNNWSRQTGKSFTKSLRRIVRGIDRGQNQLFLSAGERQSRELMMKARNWCRLLKQTFEFGERDAGVFEGVTFRQLQIDLPKVGIRIIGLPANPMTARGFTGDVFLDEFAMHAHDREIWAAMFPSVMRNKGELDIASTPKGKQNKFYELRASPSYGHQTVTIIDAVYQGLSGVEPEELRAAMGDEELWRQEFLCEFIDEATAFLTLDVIRACESDDVPLALDVEALASHKGDVLVGVDIGRKRDLTVIWVLEAVNGQLATLGLIELASSSFREQFERLAEVLHCRCVRKCCIDATGLGMQLAEQAAERFGAFRVEPVTFTANSKEEIAGKLRVKMEEKSVRIPADRRIRDDLHSIEKSVTLDGHIRLRATRQAGSHADRFWAVALAVHAAADEGGPIDIVTSPRRPMSGARRI